MEHTSHDSLTVARRIGEAGMEQAQADAIAWAIQETFKEEVANLGAKADLVILKGEVAEVKGEVAELRGEIAGVKGEITEVKGEIVKVNAKIGMVTSELKEEISHLRAFLSWMPLRVCWLVLFTLATTAGILLAAQQLWIF